MQPANTWTLINTFALFCSFLFVTLQLCCAVMSLQLGQFHTTWALPVLFLFSLPSASARYTMPFSFQKQIGTLWFFFPKKGTLWLYKGKKGTVHYDYTNHLALDLNTITARIQLPVMKLIVQLTHFFD
uniref:Uncharacterized protein n=1 Tax=Hordeum vulgare subsp. vulgare TaxID=112509 RepID=A0A8I6WVE4_HORVV